MNQISGSQFAEGELFDRRYKIQRHLGGGGMGDVYLAEDTLLGDDVVALKVLKPEQSREDRQVKRFLREVQLTRKVTHPNVARTFEAGNFDGRLYFTMEFVEGRTLEGMISLGVIPHHEAIEILRQVCSGLEAIHEVGIVHRDLKPSNLMLSPQGLIKITDFGVARPASSSLTKADEVIGSAPYMAPEVWTGAEVSPATDLYSLGALVYQMVTGMPPFDGETSAELMYKHLQEAPVAPHDLEDSIPPWFSNVIMRMLAKRPSDRPLSASSLCNFLDESRTSTSSVMIRMDEIQLFEPSIDAVSGPTRISQPQVEVAPASAVHITNTSVKMPRVSIGAWASVVVRTTLPAVGPLALWYLMVYDVGPALLPSSEGVPTVSTFAWQSLIGFVAMLALISIPFVMVWSGGRGWRDAYKMLGLYLIKVVLFQIAIIIMAFGAKYLLSKSFTKSDAIELFIQSMPSIVRDAGRPFLFIPVGSYAEFESVAQMMTGIASGVLAAALYAATWFVAVMFTVRELLFGVVRFATPQAMIVISRARILIPVISLALCIGGQFIWLSEQSTVAQFRWGAINFMLSPYMCISALILWMLIGSTALYVARLTAFEHRIQNEDQ